MTTRNPTERTTTAAGGRTFVRSPTFLWTLLAIQAAATVFFIFDSVGDALGLGTGAWVQILEYVVTVALVGGLVLTALTLRNVMSDNARMARQLDLATGAFHAIVEQHFEEWGLTPSEADVAWLAIKGLSTAEMAALRGSAEGTIKAHSAAVYRKAGVAGRMQLLSLFVEELMVDPVLPTAAQ